MTKQIHIGDVSIPLDAYAIGGTALLGIRASGKTYCAKSIAEQLLEHRVPIIVFDPIGVWRHLKVPAAGKNGKGYPVVVAGGRGADLELTPATAQQIVRAAMHENVPLVIDLYDKTMSKADWRRIVQTCFRTLLYENEGMRHIFLEEAAEYCPQKVQDGETYAEVEKLVRMGGNASLGITLINQRAQEVNKAVLDLCENLVLMRQMGAHAIDALEKWIDKVSPDFAERIAAGMPKMTAGQAWVFAGGADKPVFTRTGTIRTYHPDRKNPDAKASTTATDTSSFVAAMQRALPAIVEQQEANDPRKLRARIAELEKKISGVGIEQAKQVADAVDERLRGRLVTLEADNRALEQHRDDYATAFRTLQQRFIEVRAHADEIVEAFTAIPAAPDYPTIKKPSTPVPTALPPPARLPSRAQPAAPASRTHNDLGLSKPDTACLRAVYWLRDDDKTSEKVAFYAGYSVSSSSFTNALGALRSAGLLQGLAITDAGAKLIGPTAGEKPTGGQLREWARPKLGRAENAVLDALIDAAGQRLPDEAIGAKTGYSTSSSSFTNALGRLRSIGAAEGYAKNGGTCAAAVFFE